MSIAINRNPSPRAPSTAPGNHSDLLRRLLEKAGPEKKAAISPSASGGAPGSATSVEQPETGTMQISQTSSPMAKTRPKSGITYNGTYMQSGSFTRGGGRLVIRWRQAPPVKGQKYPYRAQAISYEIYKDGKLQTGWTLTGLAYLDSNGKVHLPVRPAKGLPRLFKSTQSFFSADYNTLVKLMNQFRAEAAHIKKKGWKNLPFAYRNKAGKIVATQSTLVLGGLIKKIGAKVLAHSKDPKAPRPFASRVFDNIERLLKNKYLGGLAHRVVETAGLKVAHHKVHGRRLVVGSYSAAGATPGSTQYNTNAGLVSAAPLRPEFIDGLNRLAGRMGTRNAPTEQEVDETLRLYNQQFTGYNGFVFNGRMAAYLLGQRSVFPGGETQAERILFRSFLDALLENVRELREGEITIDQFESELRSRESELGALRPRMRPANLVNLVLQMPGFEITHAARRNNARELLVDAAGRIQALEAMRRQWPQVHDDIWRMIYHIAGYLLVPVAPFIPKP